MVCPDAVIDYTAEKRFPSAVDLQRIERSPKVPEAAQLSDGRESDLPEASLEEAAPIPHWPVREKPNRMKKPS